MSKHEIQNESLPLVDRAVAAVHQDSPDAEAVRLAADRVWQRLSAEAAESTAEAVAAADEVGSIRGCDDYQALIPAYMAGELAPARRLLLEDHSRECVSCRRALIAARSAGTAAAAPARPHRTTVPQRHWLRFAAAAVLLLAVLGAGYLAWDGWLGGGPVATVAAVDGGLLAVDSDRAAMARLAGGAVLYAGEPVRTAKGSSAVVELNDGSRVELDERTQIRVRERRSGSTVYVDRGAIIIEAAPQPRRRHLYVQTDEARVEVTGTIFAVQHGVKGSRVSVVEGEVRVHQGRELTVLHPGQQVTTRASLGLVPVEEDVAWSRNVDRYLVLLSELSTLRQEIARRVAPAELRYASALSALAPADTLIYAAVPNLSGTLAESFEVFQERLAASPALAGWWAEQGPEHQADIEDAIARLRDFGSYLGSEVAIALPAKADQPGEPGAPVIFAEVERPDAFRAFLEQELARLSAEHGELDGLVLVGDLAELPAAGDGDRLFAWLGDGLLVASPEPDRLRAAVNAAGAGGGFAGSELGAAVAAAYADGTQWLLAVDLASIFAAEAATDTELAASGLTDLEQLVVERWDEGERAVMTADLSFGAERRGVASWLAAPAPMGSLDFVSADASVAAAFVVKEPTALLDDVLAMAGEDDEGFAELEAELGLSVRDDLAAPLGGEVAFAVDGPFLPEPSWKVILEVYDPATLQHTLETAVAEADRKMREEGGEGLFLASEEAGGRTYHRIGKAGTGGQASYVFVDGYLVAAPSRALLERTLAQRDAGSTLASSAKFRNLLPLDGRADFSAVFFQHLGPLLSPLSGTLTRLGSGSLTPEQQQALQHLAAESQPTLAYAYAEAERITVAGTGPGGPLGLGMNALTGAGGLASLGHALSVAAEEGAAEEGAQAPEAE
jgi:hypothetical protein